MRCTRRRISRNLSPGGRNTVQGESNMQTARRQFLQWAAGVAVAPLFPRLALALELSDPTDPSGHRFRTRSCAGYRRAGDRTTAVGAARAAMSSSTTGPAPAAISPPSLSSTLPPMAIRCSTVLSATPSTPVSISTWISTSSTTLRRSPARSARRASGGHAVGAGPDRSRIHRLCQGQSRQDQLCLERLSAPCRIWRANCSSRWPASKLVHVPYRSSYMADLLAASVQLTFVPIATTIAQGQSRQVRRSRGDQRGAFGMRCPNMPTVAEFVPGYRGQVSGTASPRPSDAAGYHRQAQSARSMPCSPTPRQRPA